MGDFLDDTNLSALSAKTVKAFLDLDLLRACCGLLQSEPRALADNPYDLNVELPGGFVGEVSFQSACLCGQRKEACVLPHGWHFPTRSTSLRTAYVMFKTGIKGVPSDFAQNVRKEQERVKEVTHRRRPLRKENKQEEQKRAKMREALFGDRPQKNHCVFLSQETGLGLN